MLLDAIAKLVEFWRAQLNLFWFHFLVKFSWIKRKSATEQHHSDVIRFTFISAPFRDTFSAVRVKSTARTSSQASNFDLKTWVSTLENKFYPMSKKSLVFLRQSNPSSVFVITACSGRWIISRSSTAKLVAAIRTSRADFLPILWISIFKMIHRTSVLIVNRNRIRIN